MLDDIPCACFWLSRLAFLPFIPLHTYPIYASSFAPKIGNNDIHAKTHYHYYDMSVEEPFVFCLKLKTNCTIGGEKKHSTYTKLNSSLTKNCSKDNVADETNNADALGYNMPYTALCFQGHTKKNETKNFLNYYNASWLTRFSSFKKSVKLGRG